MTTLSLIVATLGVLVCLAVWGGCHWLAKQMDRDDRKDAGYFD